MPSCASTHPQACVCSLIPTQVAFIQALSQCFPTGSSLSPASSALSWGLPGAPSPGEEQAWELRLCAGAWQAKTRCQPSSPQGFEPARTLFSEGVQPALPPCVNVCRRDVHPHGGGPTFSRSRAHTPPACMEGLVLENTLVSAQTLTLSHSHTYFAPGPKP